MIGKAVRLLAILSIAGGVPYAWFNDSVSSLVRGQLSRVWSERPQFESAYEPPLVPVSYPAASAATAPMATAAEDRDRPAGPIRLTTAPLAEVLRFDIDDRWVTYRWPRVSTILSDQKRSGLRVPLVTGSELTDIAGSLSYYFDERGRVRRISFRGHAGDASKLIEFARQRFQLRREPTLGAGLYLTRWNALPTNGLRIRHAPVVRANDPHSRLEVAFEVNRPDAGYSLSPEFLALIDRDWKARQ